MSRLPRGPDRPLPALEAGDVVRLTRGTRLARAYFLGRHSGSWNGFRSWGPSARGRFDHQMPPARVSPDRAILYAAGDGVTAVVEAFQATSAVNRTRDEPWLAVLSLRRQIRLLDLRGSWSTRAGASMALSAADEPSITQAWARAIYEEYESVHGVIYPSAMRGRPETVVPSGIDPRLFCQNLALFERAQASLAARPRLHLPLAHAGLSATLGEVAARYGYEML